MAKHRERNQVTDLVTFQPADKITVLPPNSGIVGAFLEQTANMFKARAMRMNGLLRRINESGQRTEQLLRQAAEKMESAEAALGAQFRSEGLLSDCEKDVEIEG